MTRVLVGDFGALVRAGVEDMLRAEQIEVLHSDGDLLERLIEDLPDAVVLNLDDEDAVELARQISILFPALIVIVFSAKDPTMRVFPRFHHGESYLSSMRGGALPAATTGG